MSVLLALDDAWVNIYEMNAGVAGDIQTPTDNWRFVEGITLADSAQMAKKNRIGTRHGRSAYLGSSITLSVEKLQTGNDEFDFANNRTKEYQIDLLYYDSIEGETDADAKIIKLYYCRPSDRSIATAQRGNKVSRKWEVGEIQDNSYMDTTTMAWNTATFDRTAATSKTVNHNLGYKPIVWLEGTGGEEKSGKVVHADSNSFTVSFSRTKAETITIHYA